MVPNNSLGIWENFQKIQTHSDFSIFKCTLNDLREVQILEVIKNPCLNYLETIQNARREFKPY